MNWWLALRLLYISLAVVSALLVHKGPRLFGRRKAATMIVIIFILVIGPIGARFKHVDRSKFPNRYKA
jgi:hypothetical protein